MELQPNTSFFNAQIPTAKTKIKERTSNLVYTAFTKHEAYLVHGGRVSGKSLGVSTLQAAEPPYSVNNGPMK